MIDLTLEVQIMGKSSNIYRFAELRASKAVDHMQAIVENKLNPYRYHLSSEAKKRLKWMYIIIFECKGNITLAANRVGISRTWLSQLHSHWKSKGKNPRSLEPKSRAPLNARNRQRISSEKEMKILEIRKEHPTWGKDKIAGKMRNGLKLPVGGSTVNRYLHKHRLICVKLSLKNQAAWETRKDETAKKFRCRPPKQIKDYKPGALIEKDMKYIVKQGEIANVSKRSSRGNCWYQQTFADSFTRIRVLGLTKDFESQTVVACKRKIISRFPFKTACFNTDGGAENMGDFEKHLEQKNICHFQSRSGTPTDNPRVERSHLTDDLEFYNQGHVHKTFEEQEAALLEWERTYNFDRPHQALGQLTPMEFYALWKKDPLKAYAIKDKYQAYLNKQKQRLGNARRMKKKEQVEKLMRFIDQKLSKN